MSAKRATSRTTGDVADESAAPAVEDELTQLRAEVAALGYEDARDALVEVVRTLESGTASLEESLALWQRGEALAQRCEQWLDGAQARIDDAVSARTDAPQN